MDRLNGPNVITGLRMIMSPFLFALISEERFTIALVMFIVISLMDVIDGWWARRAGCVTELGRVLDPLADKVLILGTFIFLSVIQDSQVETWMVLVIAGREGLITVLRHFFEQRSVNFSASTSGKMKMLLQSIAVALSLLALARGTPGFVAAVAVYTAVVATVVSGLIYLYRAREAYRRMRA